MVFLFLLEFWMEIISVCMKINFDIGRYFDTFAKTRIGHWSMVLKIVLKASQIVTVSIIYHLVFGSVWAPLLFVK